MSTRKSQQAKLAVREVRDPRAVIQRKGERKEPAYMKYKFHTIEIAEQEGEKDYVEVCMAGTEKDEKTGEEMPVGPLNLWIKRGQPVANVPTWAVHILLDTAVETRFHQESRDTANGGKKRIWIPTKRKSYPISLIESYNEKMTLDADEDGISETEPADDELAPIE